MPCVRAWYCNRLPSNAGHGTRLARHCEAVRHSLRAKLGVVSRADGCPHKREAFIEEQDIEKNCSPCSLNCWAISMREIPPCVSRGTTRRTRQRKSSAPCGGSGAAFLSSFPRRHPRSLGPSAYCVYTKAGRFAAHLVVVLEEWLSDGN